MFISLISIANAQEPDINLTRGLVSCWSFNDTHTTASHVNDTLGKNNGTIINDPVIGVAGQIAEAIDVDGTDDDINIPDDPSIECGAACTISGWWFQDVTAGDDHLIAKAEDSAAYSFDIQTETNKIRWTISSDGSTLVRVDFTNAEWSSGEWAYLAFPYNGTATGSKNRAKIWKNGTNVSVTYSTLVPDNMFDNAEPIRVSVDNLGRFWNGKIDTVKFWNRTLSAKEILKDYNNGTGTTCEQALNQTLGITIPSDTSPPTIVIDFPPDGERLNDIDFLIRVNGTVTDETALANITINISGMTLERNGTLDLVGFFNFSGSGLAEGHYVANVTVNDTSGNQNSSVISFTVDTIVPVLTATLPVNNTDFDKTFDDFFYSSSCTDVSLFRLNISVRNSSEILHSTQNNTAGSSMQLINDFDLSTFATGNYYAVYECADDHTGNLISDYEITKPDSTTIRFTKGDEWINIKSVSGFDGSTTRLNDRYEIDYGTRTLSTYIFNVKSNKDIHIIGNKQFDGHLVIGSRWLDFENKLKGDTEIIRLSRNEVNIFITTTDLKFSSIGDLNVFTEFYNFSISESTAIDINLSTPINETVFTVNNVTFNWVQDIGGTCDFAIDDNINVTASFPPFNNSLEIQNFTNGQHQWNISCTNATISGASEFFIFTINVTEQNVTRTEALQVDVCPSTTPDAMILIALLFTALFLLWLGTIIFFFGIFGSLLLIVLSWVLVGCHGTAALVLAFLGVVGVVYYIVIKKF